MYRNISRIIKESIRSVILEAASLDEIYKSYYENKLERSVFDKIVQADPTSKPNKMGKFGKWLINIYLKNNLKLEDLYKATEYLTVFVKFNRRLQNKDINRFQSLQQLFMEIRPFIENPEQTTSKSDEVRRIKGDAEKVYEDNKWLVVVPKTEEAACYYGKGTQWCTAATKSDNKFDYYNEMGNLYINIDKLDDRKYQFHFETNQFTDEYDYSIDKPIAETIGMTNGLISFYKDVLDSDKAVIMFKNQVDHIDIDDVENVRGTENYFCDNFSGYLLKVLPNNDILYFDGMKDGFDGTFYHERNYNGIMPYYDYHDDIINFFILGEDKFVFEERENLTIKWKGGRYCVVETDDNYGVFDILAKEFLIDEPNISKIYPLKSYFDRNYMKSWYDLRGLFVLSDGYNKQIYSAYSRKMLTDFNIRKIGAYENINGILPELIDDDGRRYVIWKDEEIIELKK